MKKFIQKNTRSSYLEIVQGPHSPLLFLQYTYREGNFLRGPRSVCGIVEANSSYYVCVTVAHAFAHLSKESQVYLHTPKGKAVSMKGVISVSDPQQRDMHALLIPKKALVSKIFQPGCATNNDTVYVCQNTSNQLESQIRYHVYSAPYELHDFHVMIRSKFGEMEQEIIAHYDPKKEERMHRLEQEGYYHTKSLRMHTEVGCSGSPVFSSSGYFLGMNIGGTMPHSRSDTQYGNVLLMISCEDIIDFATYALTQGS